MFPIGMYSMYDKLAQVYIFPFPAENDEVAVRSFQEILKDPHSAMSRHAEDYCLFRIGKLHQDTGAIDAEGEVVRVSEGVGLPGMRADVARANELGMSSIKTWLMQQAAQGVDIRKMLDGTVS